MSFDVKCYDLASVFLKDNFIENDRLDKVPEEAVNVLAQKIQDTIEDFIELDLGDFDQ